MIRPRPRANSTTNRTGHTLIELTIAMSVATVLMLGLSSALLVSTAAFQGERSVHLRSMAAEVQADMLTDLQQATGFTTKTATSVTFTVPDRDGDTRAETITYNWNSRNSKLHYIYNGSPAETLLTDVDRFELSYLTRSLTGSIAPLSPFDPDTWGRRWQKPNALFGYDTNFTRTREKSKAMLATAATLPESGDVFRIVAYIELTGAVNAQVTYAIYDDNAGVPNNLVVAAGTIIVSTSGWRGIDIAPTTLPPGQYWLALAYDNKKVKHHYQSSTGLSETKSTNPFTSGWISNWSEPTRSSERSISIYAEYTPN